jgi:D-sedoheptulose 7-phosphate isomerase
MSVDGMAIVERYLSDLRESAGSIDIGTLGRIVEVIAAALTDGRTVFLAGNGGSAAAAAHMAVDWATAGAVGGWRTVVVNLADSAARLTALGNDLSFAEAFSYQIAAQGTEGDLLVLLSVSGSSPNLVRAAKAGASLGLCVIGLLGHPGELIEYCTRWALVGRGDYGVTEDLHVSINHMVVRAVRGGRPHLYQPAAE